jgi:hypothetical protein
MLGDRTVAARLQVVVLRKNLTMKNVRDKKIPTGRFILKWRPGDDQQR